MVEGLKVTCSSVPQWLTAWPGQWWFQGKPQLSDRGMSQVDRGKAPVSPCPLGSSRLLLLSLLGLGEGGRKH